MDQIISKSKFKSNALKYFRDMIFSRITAPYRGNLIRTHSAVSPLGPSRAKRQGRENHVHQNSISTMAVETAVQQNYSEPKLEQPQNMLGRSVFVYGAVVVSFQRK